MKKIGILALVFVLAAALTGCDPKMCIRDREEIVLGYPKNMNNTLGERALKSEEFKKQLEARTNLPVVLWDERLTTVAAQRALMEGGVRRENRKDTVDMLAAVLKMCIRDRM